MKLLKPTKLKKLIWHHDRRCCQFCSTMQMLSVLANLVLPDFRSALIGGSQKVRYGVILYFILSLHRITTVLQFHIFLWIKSQKFYSQFLNKIYNSRSYGHCCPPFTSGVCPFTLLMAWMADAAAVKLGAWLLKHNGLKPFLKKYRW